MNERILELMAEAGFDVEKLRMYPGGFPREDLLVLEDFAKLIVQECAQVADTERPGYLGCGYITKTTGMRIKEHFGVDG